MTMIKIQFFC